MRPNSIPWFQPERWPSESLLSFFLADLIFLVVGSLVSAIAVLSEGAWAAVAIWLQVGLWLPRVSSDRR